MRFRKVRRKTHESRTRTEAGDRGAHQALLAGGYAGAGTWHAIPGQSLHFHNGDLANAYNAYNAGIGTGFGHQHQLNAQNANSQLLAQQQVQFNQMKALMLSRRGLQYWPGLTETPDPLPRDIRAGEIIAYRAWELRVVDGNVYYESMHSPTIWENGQMTAEQAAGEAVTDYGHAGVYAWKTEQHAEMYVLASVRRTYAIGEVEMWGEVVEHDLGYRAEHAKIRRITQIVYPITPRKDVSLYINEEGMVAIRAANPPYDSGPNFVGRIRRTIWAILLALGAMIVLRSF